MVDKIEKILKARRDKSRLRIIDVLSEKPLCVCEELTEVLKLSPSTVCGHLNVVKDTRIVEDEKDQLWVEYRPCENEKFNFCNVNSFQETLKSNRKREDERKIVLPENREGICRKLKIIHRYIGTSEYTGIVEK